MTADDKRTWGGRTLEDRRAGRREQLLDAGMELLGTQGAAHVTVRAVCRATRLSERYFYESFPDRDAFVVAVHARVADAARAAIAAAVQAAKADPVSRATAAVEAFTRFLEDDPRRGRVLLSEAFADRALTRHGVELIPSFAELVVEQIRTTFGDDGPDEVDARMTSVALVGALAQLYLGWLDGGLDVSRERLVAHAVRLVLSSAGVSSRP